ERLGDRLVVGGAAGLALDRLARVVDLAGHAAHAARHDVAAAELVEHRATDALGRVHEERLTAALVEAVGGLGQTEQTGRHEVLLAHPRRAATSDLLRDPLSDLEVVGDAAVASGGGVHA